VCPQVAEKNWGGLAAEEGRRVRRLEGMKNWESDERGGGRGGGVGVGRKWGDGRVERRRRVKI